MRFIEAKQQFQIRYYLWATSEFEREIEESFPGFRSFKTGRVWETYQFMQRLDRTEQRNLAHALLKRFHPDAVKTLGESISGAENALLSRLDNFSQVRQMYQAMLQYEESGQLAEADTLLGFLRSYARNFIGDKTSANDKSLRSELDATFGPIPRSLEEEIQSRKRKGEKIKSISKRKLLNLAAEKFQTAFPGRCHETDRETDGDPSLHFDMKCLDWIISTHFWFGRGGSLLNYSHSIASEALVEYQGPTNLIMTRLVMGSLISFTSWLGLTSQVEWEYLTPEEAEPACDAAMKLCNHFFEVAPKLLKGLEFEKLDKEIHRA